MNTQIKPNFTNLLPAEFSDEALARDFAEKHGHELRYVGAGRGWMVWNGSRWTADEQSSVCFRVRSICTVASATCGDADLGRRLASAGTVRAVEGLSRSDPRIAASVNQWDADPCLKYSHGDC
jgi:putative DNA primase/helicase